LYTKILATSSALIFFLNDRLWHTMYLRCHCNGPFLHDLLMSALDAAVSGHQGGHVAMSISQELHLQMPADGCKLHGKDWTTWHLSLDLLEHLAHLVIAMDLHDPHQNQVLN
jgi:hypothetical protein